MISELKMKKVSEEISEIRRIAAIEKVSMSFVLNVQKYLEQKRQNELFIRANVIYEGYPSALEKIAMNTEKQ